MKKKKEDNKFNKLFGEKVKNLLKRQKGYTLKKIAFSTGVSSTSVSSWYSGKKGINVYRLFQFIKLFNISDPEIVSLFKDSALNAEHKKEIKQPELVKIPEPEPTQKYCGIIKKAYDMQDSEPEIKGKLSGAFTLIESIESDIKKIKSCRKRERLRLVVNK